jgi:hypothetical protein
LLKHLAPASVIGAGAKLADVYHQTLARNLILPGGGCGDVRVGGLVQGGPNLAKKLAATPNDHAF